MGKFYLTFNAKWRDTSHTESDWIVGWATRIVCGIFKTIQAVLGPCRYIEMLRGKFEFNIDLDEFVMSLTEDNILPIPIRCSQSRPSTNQPAATVLWWNTCHFDWWFLGRHGTSRWSNVEHTRRDMRALYLARSRESRCRVEVWRWMLEPLERLC